MPSRPFRLLTIAAAALLTLATSASDARAAPSLPSTLPLSELDWSWAPLDLGTDIRVAPLVVVGSMPVLENTGFLGERLSGQAARLRSVRGAQISAVPDAFSTALPGELASALPADWRGHLSDAKVRPAARSQLTAGLDGRSSLDQALRAAVDHLPGEVVLFRWMTDVQARPLGSSAAPGTTLRAADRLVYVDQHTDPVLAEATVGLALVAADGEVFLRYEDRYTFVITGNSNAARAGRDLAQRLVDDLEPLLEEQGVASNAGGI